MVRALDTPDKQDLRKLQLLKDELVRFRCCRLALPSLDSMGIRYLCSPKTRCGDLAFLGTVLSFARTVPKGSFSHHPNV